MDMKQIQVIPYLTFQGECEEAVNAYISAFGGEIHYLSRWSEKTAAGKKERVGKVMHVEFAVGSTRMAAGDAFDGVIPNAAVRLMIHMDTMQQAQHAISVLAVGGEQISPIQPHPEPDDGGCGSVTRDRFGYTWIITCPNPAKKK